MSLDLGFEKQKWDNNKPTEYTTIGISSQRQIVVVATRLGCTKQSRGYTFKFIINLLD